MCVPLLHGQTPLTQDFFSSDHENEHILLAISHGPHGTNTVIELHYEIKKL